MLKIVIFLALVFIGISIAFKSCSGGLKLPSFAPKPGEKASVAAAQSKTTTGTVLKGSDYEVKAELFRGWVGGIGQLRTDKGQYAAGQLSIHGMCEMIQGGVYGYTARCRGPAGLVYVLAVDEYRELPPPAEKEDKGDAKNQLANPPVAPVNASPVAAVPKIVVGDVGAVRASPPVVEPESLKMTRQQQRQAARGVLVKGPFKSEVKMTQ